MNKLESFLIIKFDNNIKDRDEFLQKVRMPVINFTKETMRLDALIHEILKNIYDHAEGKGSLYISKAGNEFEFYISDEGTELFDIKSCIQNWQPKNKDVNFGIGLNLINQLADSLNIKLIIETSKGFSYRGIYLSERNR
ncbi:MAG: ATP-binding protein [Candidatus Pacebacteria bacterium]|nr:ATP-binding protein [Candidatus Paceibacterota bacterium]